MNILILYQINENTPANISNNISSHYSLHVLSTANVCIILYLYIMTNQDIHGLVLVGTFFISVIAGQISLLLTIKIYKNFGRQKKKSHKKKPISFPNIPTSMPIPDYTKVGIGDIKLL